MLATESILFIVWEYIGDAINILWLFIITRWVVKAARDWLKDEWKMIVDAKHHVRKLMHVRRDLAVYLLLWLEFIVASDIIDTMLHLDKEKLILLGGLVVIRVVVWYMLDKEITEYEKMKVLREERIKKSMK